MVIVEMGLTIFRPLLSGFSGGVNVLGVVAEDGVVGEVRVALRRLWPIFDSNNIF
jgi:hypothetical protein